FSAKRVERSQRCSQDDKRSGPLIAPLGGSFGFALNVGRFLDSDSGDAVTVELFHRVAAAFVFEALSQGRNPLQPRQDESGESFETGVARQSQAVFSF